jgi:tRNA1(Val) A37 N6-methylase TrmN6
MSAISAEEAIDETGFLASKVLLRQPRRGHRAGTDAALLIAAARPYAKGRIADLGAGVGTIGLSLAVLDPGLEVALVEIDPLLARLAGEAAPANGRAAQLRVVNADVRALASDARARASLGAPYDLVVMNPPFTNSRERRASPDPLRAKAHMMREGELSLWVDAAATLLKANAAFVMIHRPEALSEVLGALSRGFGAIMLRPVQPRGDEAATRILILARKGARAPLSIVPPLVLHEAGGAFTPVAAAIHRGEIELPFA